MKAIYPQNLEYEKGCLRPGKNKVWKFVSHEDYHYQSKILDGKECDFNWLKISGGILTVKGTFYKGYAWDGCTPKFNFLHITWGNFDGQLIKHTDEMTGAKTYRPFTYYASMVHDVVYQYKRCVPLTRREADLLFYEMLKKSGYMWAWIYFTGVKLFGWIYGGWRN